MLFSPCKKCLVRPACSKDCKEFNDFVQVSTSFVALIAIIISAIILFFGFYHLGIFSNNSLSEQRQMIVVIVWIITGGLSLLMNTKTDEKMGEIVVILFAPYVFLVFITIFILTYLFTRNIRKRA